MYFVKTPVIVKSIFSDFKWSVDTNENTVFLTFDDGPTPGVTNFVLKTLEQFGFLATFFCVGKNVKEHAELYQKIIDGGHAVGNHTYDHNHGWTHSSEEYIKSVEKCDHYVESSLFRPPYGKMRYSQSKIIKENKTIVMWDVLSGDFDETVGWQECASNVIENYTKGSIIVFHDSLKCAYKLRKVLPLVCQHLQDNNFRSNTL